MFTLVPDVAWGSSDGNGGTAGPLKTANTAVDGTGTVLTVFTAGANGSYVTKLIARSAGTNVLSVLRVFINNGSANSTIANNILTSEVTLPASTVSQTGALLPVELPLGFALPAGFKINVTVGTTIAAGVWVSVQGGDY